MERYVKTLLLLLTILLGCPDSISASNGNTQEKLIPVERVTDNGKATNAVIVDAQNLVRICSSRPQRVVSLSIGKPGRIWVRNPHLLHDDPLQNHLAEWVTKSHTSPFLPAVSSDYFVFALRRLRC